jgi:NADH-quinone oxidoreductase subunit L
MQGEFLMQIAWLIPVLPFVLFAVIGLFLYKTPKLAGLVSIAGIAFNCVLSWSVALKTFANGPNARYEVSIPWIDITGLRIDMSLLIDPLSAVMLIIVTTVALLVQIYSWEYMHDDPGFARYYAYQSMFAGAMLGLVLANNFGQLFIFWELVGVCSFLLIGFWYGRDSAKMAARKAFISNRVGDVGLLLGIVMLQFTFGTMNFDSLTAQIATYSGTALLTVIAILLFVGPMGKSAQFPLHVWLPDAMEGPTPVSALIHAATMVAAGVYLLARCFLIFSSSPEAMMFIAVVGGFTALFAATIALVQNDIKRILAYSGLFYFEPIGIYGNGNGYRSDDGRYVSFVYSRFFQRLIVLGSRQCYTCHERGAEYLENGGLK